MAAEYLIDTSVVIKYLNQTLPTSGIAFIDRFVNDDCTISFISEIELLIWNPDNPNDIMVYNDFVTQAEIVGINPGIITETINIRKTYRLKIADAIIAATALQSGQTLIADNDKDFTRIPILKYINPRGI